ncbi:MULTISPECIES: hypothetical protein [unclassified Rhodococcus (in: high G+C Gram-positive bacteria)]|uniref:hypothetical protein n=1 Tax=unclassified Rhodococcus (in: high G+C Gram-positive bacteria) TaxID=192944 RepID=UPI00289D52A8|nr:MULTISPECIES: hypothetical protein [unclassified Rhodococcus (in: high G+C Gram-positive bacteria)]
MDRPLRRRHWSVVDAVAGVVRRVNGDGRFFAATLVVNFLLVPVVVAAMFTFLPADQAVRIGVLLVLLCPSVDYVIVFSGLAGGGSRRLLAATPLLLLIAQMLLLPGFLVLFLGTDLSDIVEVGPYVTAFVVLIAIPLGLAWVTQFWVARAASGRRTSDAATSLMVPLMAVTLAVVVASQAPKLEGQVAGVAAVVPFYAAFLVVMSFAGLLVARAFRLPGERWCSPAPHVTPWSCCPSRWPCLITWRSWRGHHPAC